MQQAANWQRMIGKLDRAATSAHRLPAVLPALAASLLAFALAPQPGLAQTKEKAKPASERLEKLQNELRKSRKRRKTLEKEAEALDRQRGELRSALITKAAQVQDNEAAITAIEKKLKALRLELDAIEVELNDRRGTLAGLLAGLQRLQRNPPPALAVQPHDALGAVRSAMLLGTVVPEVRGEAEKLARSLNGLRQVRQSISSERTRLARATTALTRERKEMKELLAAKQTASEMTRAEIEAEKKRTQQLAKKSKSLKDLIARLGADVRTTRDGGNVTATDPDKADRRPTVQARALKPTVPFSRTKGRLTLPVSGETVLGFGAEDGFGSRVKGMSLATRPQAQVTAPADGKVAFAGSFRRYGQLLIISAGEGYHILLAGMDRINVNVGQFVLAGEPVGNMGQDAAESTVIGAKSGDNRPILYVEFRRKGKSIDSRPWWKRRVTKVSG